MPLHPLKFKPRFVEKIWGGRKIESVLGKPLPPGLMIGESWELYDFPPGVVDNSTGWISAVVSEGPLAGRTLHELVGEYGDALTGGVALSGQQARNESGKEGRKQGQFPILIKFLDAREDLSVQVHPDDDYCRKNAGAHLKSEAWYVFQHDPGAKLYKGLQAGATPETLRAAVADGTVERQIKTAAVKDGQCYYLPSGTIHALGAGMLVAEVQTPSDTTFRVFDFNRIEAATGKPRKLHVEEAMQCIDFSAAADAPQKRDHVAGLHTTVTRLVSSPYFTIEKVRFAEGVEEPVPYDEPVVWIMLEGEAQVKVDDVKEAIRFKRGDTVLLPAKLNRPILKTLSNCSWLEVTFPTAS